MLSRIRLRLEPKIYVDGTICYKKTWIESLILLDFRMAASKADIFNALLRANDEKSQLISTFINNILECLLLTVHQSVR